MKKKKVIKWFKPGIPMGWKKDMLVGERRQTALMAHKGDKLATARALNALANVTADKETEREARKDAQYFFRQYRKGNE